MSSATITAVAGPAITVTALPITNVTKFEIDTEANMLVIYTSNSPSPLFFALSGSNTFTLTASGGTYSLTVA